VTKLIVAFRNFVNVPKKVTKVDAEFSVDSPSEITQYYMVRCNHA
jgi:hypothetical protein